MSKEYSETELPTLEGSDSRDKLAGQALELLRIYDFLPGDSGAATASFLDEVNLDQLESTDSLKILNSGNAVEIEHLLASVKSEEDLNELSKVIDSVNKQDEHVSMMLSNKSKPGSPPEPYLHIVCKSENPERGTWVRYDIFINEKNATAKLNASSRSGSVNIVNQPVNPDKALNAIRRRAL